MKHYKKHTQTQAINSFWPGDKSTSTALTPAKQAGSPLHLPTPDGWKAELT